MQSNKSGNKDRGQHAEDAACGFLTSKGFEIINRNVRFAFGELDIVAMDGQILCFVEVRSKNKTDFGTPQATVMYEKQSKIIKLAELYLVKNYKQKLPICRFDVVAVVGYGSDAKIEHFKNAFETSIYGGKRGGSPWKAY